MALLDEELVEQWLNKQRFFTMRGIKLGLDEIDFLCVRHDSTSPVCWHVETQVSFRPMGYIGGDTNARRRSEEEIRAGVEQWVSKKFTSERKRQKRDQLLPGANWQFVLVCAEVREDSELALMGELGVRVVRYREVLEDLIEGRGEHQSSSIAHNIVDILRYVRARAAE